MRELSASLELPYLAQICDNIENEEEFLNPSIGTYLCDVTGAAMKKCFMNKKELADVIFKLPSE